LLPLVEFAYNNTIKGSIHQTPFFANYGYHQSLISSTSIMCKIQQLETIQLSKIHTEIKDKLLEAQDQQKDNANKS
jgi:hypothetical protein